MKLPEELKPPPIKLIGEGVDAIVRPAMRKHDNWFMRLFWPAGTSDPDLDRGVSPEDRLARYHDAINVSGVMLADFEARERRGELLKRQWELGSWPKVGKQPARRPQLRSVA